MARRCTGSARSSLALLAALLLAACSAVQYNLPAVTTDSDGLRRSGKFIWHDLISDTPEASQAFFSELLGWEFRSLELLGARYWLISLDGTPIAGMVSQDTIPAERDVSQWISVMSVDDVEQTTRQLRAAGGEVYREPVSIGERGTIAVYADPQGAVFAALSTRSGDPPDRSTLPPEGGFLWHELWTPSVPEAVDFYAALAKLEGEEADDQGPAGQAISYAVMRSNGLARSGIRSLPDPDMPPLWMPFLRISDAARLQALLRDVPRLGGRVLVPATPRPAGGLLAVIAGPSGAPIALQTWGEDQPMVRDI